MTAHLFAGFFCFFLKFFSKKEKNRYFLTKYFYFQRSDAIKTVFAATNFSTVFPNAAYLFSIAPKSLRVYCEKSPSQRRKASFQRSIAALNSSATNAPRSFNTAATDS